MAAAKPRCLKFTFKTKYADVDGEDCCGADADAARTCVDSEYCFRATTPASVGDFITSVTKTNFPTLSAQMAAYFTAQYEALSATGSFQECKQFDQVDAAGAVVVDGYAACVCMTSVDATKRRRSCICDKDKSCTKCH